MAELRSQQLFLAFYRTPPRLRLARPTHRLRRSDLGLLADRHTAARSLTGLSARQAAEEEGIEPNSELTGGDARILRGINGCAASEKDAKLTTGTSENQADITTS